MFPPGTTWLDVVTLAIACVGAIVGCVGAFLAIRTDRRESKIGVRVDAGIVPGANAIAVVMTNTERRTVTIQRVRLLAERKPDSAMFERWRDVNVRRGESGFPLSDLALPKTLEPAGIPYGVTAGASAIKSAFFPALPRWALCEDTLGNLYWGELPADVLYAIKAAKRTIAGPDDDYGHPTLIEIEDDDPRSS